MSSSTNRDIDSNGSHPNAIILIVFGRPGAGKTTITELALEVLKRGGVNHVGERPPCLHLDLDCVVPTSIKENFAKGIYPTLQERTEFAHSACEYVMQEMDKVKRKDTTCTKAAIEVLISFSFVNTDLRDVFQERFPNAYWNLIDVKEDVAQDRILQRQGHFYKGKQTCVEESSSVGGNPSSDNDADNSEWKFAAVTFSHIVLDGMHPVDVNARKLYDAILKYRANALLPE